MFEMEGKIDEEELCCADKNVCSLECVPKKNSESGCSCGGNC